MGLAQQFGLFISWIMAFLWSISFLGLSLFIYLAIAFSQLILLVILFIFPELFDLWPF